MNGREGCSGMQHDVIMQMVYSMTTPVKSTQQFGSQTDQVWMQISYTVDRKRKYLLQ